MATVTTKVNDKTLFLVEAKQGGIFEIRNIPEEQLQPILGIACPGIVYPYLRAIVSDVCTRAGFPPVRAVGGQLPGDVRGAAGAGRAAGPGRRADQRLGRAGHAELTRRRGRPRRHAGTRGDDEPHGPRRRRVGHGPGRPRLGRRTRRGSGRATRRRRRELRVARRNARYLPTIALPAALAGRRRPRRRARAMRAGGLVVIATPMAGLEPMLRRLPGDLDAPVLWLCKGFQDETALLGHEIARAALPEPARRRALRAELRRSRSRAASRPRWSRRAATRAVRAAAVAAFHAGALRVYTSADPVGVEVGGAVKNVLAIATGIADGMALGLNARAALVTRGLAEMTRLGVALGAEAATFMGLSGLGDLVLTTTGDLSRNRSVGLELARGRALADILAALGHVAEGVRSAPMVLRARRHAAASRCRSSPPSSRCSTAGSRRPQALAQLMRREARAESL